jgi:pimeloyl-ACP methyl ester carboxylesterase
MSSPAPPSFLDRPDGQRVAYRRFVGRPDAAGLVWLGGYRSDMEGGKAVALDGWAQAQNRSFLRFDYFGHGASSGDFKDGAIGRWRADAIAAIDALTEGRQILVGSSMGGWIALLAALARPEKVAALLLIAPAPDFTERLMWAAFPEPVRETIRSGGIYELPSDYGFPPTPITRGFIEDGRRWLLYGAETIPIRVPVKIIQGLKDPDVPWRHALELVARLTESPDVEFFRVENGDHRLSTEADIARLLKIADRLAAQVDEAAAKAASSASTAGKPSR